ncbi:MAG: carboxypeptidase regulatory-like domain-containing protein, partial [Planctomycetota bacterium]|nr:carboxypeptidase regulatory-like domain-containing protein [Planctomycetota bacterium]
VAGASVQAKPHSGMMFGSMFVGQKKSGIQTDNNGYAFLENLSQNKYRVVASAEGYADSFSIVEFKKGEEEAETTVTMKEGTRIIGRVLRAKDQTPVTGAVVFVRKLEKNKARRGPPEIPSLIQTEKEGRFKSKALNPGTYQINVSAEGLQSFIKTVTVSLDKKIEDLGDLSLEPLQSLEVTVLDIEGKPLVGARVRVNQEAQGMRIRASSSGSESGEQEEDVDISIGGMDSEKTTNDQGVVVLKSVSPGKVSLHVTIDGQPDGFLEDVPVTAGAGLSRATVRLMKSGKIEGSVTGVAGSPGGNLTVYLFRKGHKWPITTAKSDADGNYVFSKVCPGSYLLRVNNMLPLSAGEKFIDLRSEETLREDLVAPAPKGEK